MKKSLFILSLGLILSLNHCYASNSVAVVDLQKIVSNSAQVKQLKEEHAKKLDELNRIIVNARGAISNETDPTKIMQLEEKYTKEFNLKKSALEKEYNTRLSAIEKNIKNEIKQKAVAEKYDYVFAKSVLLYGGNDITQDIKIK